MRFESSSPIRLGNAELGAITELFEATYRDADLEYLAKSRATFCYVAIAEDEAELVGFAFGDSQKRRLPRLAEPQSIALAGIACIVERMRRRGLFAKLAFGAMTAAGHLDPTTRFLFAGCMAHIATYRAMARMSPSVVPAPGKPIEAWHREIAQEVAELLDSQLDLETLVARGSGRPVGFPRIEYDTTPEEEVLFAPVDRSRGDSLLSICWVPDAPEGW